MIDRSWLTAAELEVVKDALVRERLRLESVIHSVKASGSKSDARWRAHVVDELLIQLRVP